MITDNQQEKLQFIDLARQQRRLRDKIDKAVGRVLDHGEYILGPEVGACEAALSRFCGARYSISCANGTDALALVLMAKGISAGDAVIVPAFTFAATAEAVAGRGATPIFVDSLPDTFNMDSESLKQGLRLAEERGLTTRAIIAVDLFGLPADYDAIEAIAAEHSLTIICDSAQAFGADYKGRKVGTIGDVTTTSFFPAKPLGCYGDGGAIFTEDGELATIVESLRFHGRAANKYDNVRIGLNSRLDTLQAAVLLEKIAVFAEEIEARNRIAQTYSDALAGVIRTPDVPAGLNSVWAQYTIRIAGGKRDAFAGYLRARGIPTAVYYPIPLHQQIAYRNYPVAGDGLPVAEELSKEVLSLPMHPYLEPSDQATIIEAVVEAAIHLL